MELSDYRKRLDEIDKEILGLFSERMDIAVEIASWKQENSLPVLDARREKEKLQHIEEMSDPELSDYSFTLFSMLMELSLVPPSWSTPASKQRSLRSATESFSTPHGFPL